MAKEDLLVDWGTLNKHIQTLTEKECAALLEREKNGDNRLSFVLRIYGRLNKLRNKRERKELAARAE